MNRHHSSTRVPLDEARRTFWPTLDGEPTPATPFEYAERDEAGNEEPPHEVSLSEAAFETARTGLAPRRRSTREVPGDNENLLVGDPDVAPLENDLSGGKLAGAGMPTPDPNSVDDIGRAYGITEEETKALVLGDPVIERRDLKRWELNPRSRDRVR